MQSCSASDWARPESATASPFRMASWPSVSIFSVSSPGLTGRLISKPRTALPVDLVFMLIAPEAAGADHLKALATIARLLRNGGVAPQLRATKDPAALYALLTMAPTSNAA